MEKSVLVVDDEENWRNQFIDILGSMGYAVDATSSSDEARRFLGNHSYALVLLDICLDQLDPAYVSFQTFCEFLRKNHPQLPVMAVSGEKIKPEFMFGLQAQYGVKDFISKKSLTLPDFKARVKALIDTGLPRTRLKQGGAGIDLNTEDHDRLVRILSNHPDWQLPSDRVTFLGDVFIGTPRRQDIQALIDLSGAPRPAALRTINRLAHFGQVVPGREALGVLINKLLSYGGDSADAAFLRGLFQRYPFEMAPVITQDLRETWRGQETTNSVRDGVVRASTLDHVNVLALGAQAGEAVVRLRVQHVNGQHGLGTGFLVGERLIMTNHHVIPEPEVAQTAEITFFYELDANRIERPTFVTRALAGGMFYTNAELDVTIVEVTAVPPGVQPLQLLGQGVKRNERITIIHHPGGLYKKISLHNNFVVFADERNLQYITTAEAGSSGAPLFKDGDFKVIGIHHSSFQPAEAGADLSYRRNEGTSLIAILKELERVPEIYARLQLS